MMGRTRFAGRKAAVKPRSTIIELADTALPIFGDVERDYDVLDRLKSYRAIDGGMEAEVESYEERTAQVRLAFVTPEIVRVQYVLDVEPPETTPMLAGPLPAPPTVRVSDDDRAIAIASDAVTLRVERSPFRWLLLDAAGGVVAAQERNDGALDESISVPAGWSQRGGGPPAFHETLSLRSQEQLYGLGENFGQHSRRGTRAVSWSRDPHGTNTTPLTYLNIPFFLSTLGYGIFVNQTSRAVYELGYPSQMTCSFRFEEPYLDYFLIYGPTPKDIIARYWQLTGRGALPPLWSFGAWFSRCMYRDAEQVRDVVERLTSLGVPVDVINVDPRWLVSRKHHERDGCDFVWDRAAFDEPEQFVGWLRERGVRLCLWENPYVWHDTEMYREGVARGYFAKGADGAPARSLDNEREAVVVDFTNPDAARWWQDKHRPYLRAGVAAFKSDYGEGVPVDARFSDGTSGLETHNVLPLLYNRAVWDVINEEKGEAIVFGRSGYAGSQRYPINWVGDTQCSFEGMAAALRAGLSLSLSGIPFWSHDIGGFWNPPNPAEAPDPELYIRWAQWGLLSSHARFHGIRGREPWWYGDQAIDIVRRFAILRYRLLPYLWSFANEALETATPLVRPLVLEFPDDPASDLIDSEYLLGPWLLVAPVFQPGGRVRVYLPPGRWFDFWSGAAIEGPRWLQETVPLDRLPLYVRDDSLLVRGPEMTRVGQKPWDPLEVDVRLSSKASLNVRGEGADLSIEARREGNELALDLAGSAALVLRFLSPVVGGCTVEGEASAVAEDRSEGALALSLQLDGRARVRGA
jgi:alpha-D-xyloside xylohydrolase